jgi:hypothetical protein
MRQKSKNPNIVFLPVEAAGHFTILAPVTKIVAQKILQVPYRPRLRTFSHVPKRVWS